jgi:hypothetical protein
LFIGTNIHKKILHILTNPDWWKDAHPKFMNFWRYHVCPEVVDSSLTTEAICQHPLIWRYFDSKQTNKNYFVGYSFIQIQASILLNIQKWYFY